MTGKDTRLIPGSRTKKSSASVPPVEVRLHGLDVVQRPSQRVLIPIDGPTRLGDLVAWLAQELNVPDLMGQIEAYRFAVIVNGVNAHHQEMWDTTLLPGDVVAIILPRAGG